MLRFSVVLALVSTTWMAGTHPAWAARQIVRVSVDSSGGDPDGSSGSGSASADGRYVAFASRASNLVDNDGNGLGDIFVRDMMQGITVRASVDTLGGDPNGVSSSPVISDDGRYVVFHSTASNLVPDDTNEFEDIFVRDLVAASTVRASVDTTGGDADAPSHYPAISADGQFVVFRSWASDLAPGDGNGKQDIFVRDMVAGTTVRASVSATGGDADGESRGASISAEGRFAAFHSYASNLVPEGDTNGYLDVYVRDLVNNVTIRASVNTTGGEPNCDSRAKVGLSLSADGHYVVFQSCASDLVPNDHNGVYDIFVRDLVAGTTTRVSVDRFGGDANKQSEAGSISGDGRFVAWHSNASDIVSGDTAGKKDVFIRDLVKGKTIRLSLDYLTGGDTDGNSRHAKASNGGQFIVFQSDASDLVAGDGNGLQDVFMSILGT